MNTVALVGVALGVLALAVPALAQGQDGNAAGRGRVADRHVCVW